MIDSDAGKEQWLREEAVAWVKEAIVTEDQAHAILARYGLAGSETPHTLKTLNIVRALAALGVVLVGAGVLLVVGSNWEAIPKGARLFFLCAATLSAYLGGYWLAYQRESYPGIGKALTLLGSLLWCSSVFLVGQMYQLQSTTSEFSEQGEYTAGVAYCFIGTLPMAYILASAPHMVLSLVALSVLFFLVSELDPFGNSDTTRFLLLGCFYYVAGILHRDTVFGGRLRGARALSSAISGFGVGFAVWGAYFLTFEGAFRCSTGGARQSPDQTLWVIMGIVAAIGGVVALVRLRTEGRASQYESLFVAALSAIGVWILIGMSGRHHVDDFTASMLAIAFNVLLLAIEVGLVALGWARLKPGMVNAGLVVFFIHLMTRYFDLIGSMLSGGFAFIGAGTILLGGGWALERQRRSLMESMALRAQQ